MDLHAHPALQLKNTMSRLYEEKYTTTSGGNLSVRTVEGDIYITPGSLDKGELKEEQIVRIGRDGTTYGEASPSCEWPFHLNIYRMHPEYNAIVHAHPAVLMGYSLAHRVPDTRIFPLMWDGGTVALSQYGAPGSERLMNCVGDAINGTVCAAIMANHGAVVACKDGLNAAYCCFTSLIDYAQAENYARQWNSTVNIPSDDESRTLKAILQSQSEQTGESKKMYWHERNVLAHWIQRAYRQKLISAGYGTISLRVGDDSFLINQLNVDNGYANTESFVLVHGGKVIGGIADRTWQLHREIYLKNQGISAVVTAYCPHIMGVLAGDRPLDTHCMPESFIILHELPTATISEFIQDPSAVTSRINEKQHITCLKNGFVITAGSGLKEAFDTLEVAEFSAQAALETLPIGGITPLSKYDVTEMRQLFGIG